MQPKTPWVTGFLGNILINYLERKYSSLEKQVDYAKIINSDEGYSILQNAHKEAKVFLRDVNHWYPHAFLKDLIRVCERLTCRKDLAYLATLDYFNPSNRQRPSIFEMVTEMLQDVQLTLSFSEHWASVYTNYLRLQTCRSLAQSSWELVVLSKFEDFVHPVLANGQFVQAHMEGFPRLFEFVESTRCEEEFSQLKLEEITQEFQGYVAEITPHTIIVREDRSGRKMIEAEAVYLETEELLNLSHTGSTSTAVVYPQHNGLRVLTSRILHPSRSGTRKEDVCKAYRVIRGGSLRSEGIEWTISEGQIFNAPYTRYRLTWTEKSPLQARDHDPHPTLSRARQLFHHLNAVKESQIRLLQYTVENRGLQAENQHLRQAVEEQHGFGQLIGKSARMQEVFSLLRTLSQLDTTVLILGETGTGKELVARAVHYNSPRRHRRFLAINCGAMAEGLLESELFGYERGAFTGAMSRREGKFEQADGGTLFLDEIGEIPLPMQVKLLRVLEEGEFQRVGGKEEIKVDVRIIAATHQDLKKLVEQGRFRKDLYYRLHVMEVNLPSLKDRLEDLPLLVEHFLKGLGSKLKKPIRGISPEAMIHLLNYSWPGNIRELRHVIERAMILADPDGLILPDHLPLDLRSSETILCEPAVKTQDLLEVLDKLDWDLFQSSLNRHGSLTALLKCIEGCIIQKAVHKHRGNKTQAAKALKRSYRWLRKLEKGYLSS